MHHRLILSGLFVVGACGTDLTADQACSDIANSRCTQLMACSAADLQKRWPDLVTCEAREKLACMDGLAAPSTGATPSSADACSAAISTESCDALLSNVMTPNACLPQTGPAAIGAVCSFSAQCASTFCAIASDALCGTCAAVPIAGDSCATQTCGPTLSCNTANTCVVPVTAAATCSRDAPCGAGLSCVGATMTASGTCMTEATTAGAACDPRRMTAAACNGADGLTCDSTSKTCVAQPLVAAGHPCGLIGTTVTACLGGASCILTTATAGTCVAKAADGAPCDATTGPDCEFPAKCVAGTCQLPGQASC